jgi:hypothetical protein
VRLVEHGCAGSTDRHPSTGGPLGCQGPGTSRGPVRPLPSCSPSAMVRSNDYVRRVLAEHQQRGWTQGRGLRLLRQRPLDAASQPPQPVLEGLTVHQSDIAASRMRPAGEPGGALPIAGSPGPIEHQFPSGARGRDPVRPSIWDTVKQPERRSRACPTHCVAAPLQLLTSLHAPWSAQRKRDPP